MFNKRAVSPLIATVLLVMITVSIGAAVMVVIQSITEESIGAVQANQELMKCSSDVKIEIEKKSTGYMFCYLQNSSGGYVGIVLQNKGLKDIQDWRITALSDVVSDVSSAGSSLSKGSIGRYKFNFSVQGTLMKIRLSPKITGGPNNPLVTCTLPDLEWDDEVIASLENCSSSKNIGWFNSIT